MAKIVNIDAMIPEDVEIVYKDETYVIPGDVDGETVFGLLEAFRTLAVIAAEGREGATIDSAALDAAAKNLNKRLLKLFQLTRPDLKKLPFGTKALPIVVREILQSFGLGGESPDPQPRPKTRAIPKTKKPSSPKRRQPARSR